MSAEKVAATTVPEKRSRVGTVVLVVVWAYVAAIYLLAMDQQFHWGIF
jgi:hypothetical protein